MRTIIRRLTKPIAILAAIGAVAPGALAQSPTPRPEVANAAPSTGSEPASSLAELFAELKRESNPRQARDVADRIWAEWRDSGSATVNLMMQWANEAVEEERHGTALDLLDQVTILAPDYAEGWNRRATVHYLMKNHGKSMSDINRVLELEPRHFGALAGMAGILKEAGRNSAALRAYERALDIYPADRAMQRQMTDLADELSGDPA